MEPDLPGFSGSRKPVHIQKFEGLLFPVRANTLARDEVQAAPSRQRTLGFDKNLFTVIFSFLAVY